MTQAINQNVSAPGLWDQTYNAASNAANWIGEKSRSAAASASDAGSRVWAAFSDAISNLVQFFSYYVNVAKEGLVAAKDQFVALPMNVKVVTGIAAVLTAVAGYFLAKCCAAPAPATTATTTTTQVQQPQTPAATAATTPAAPAATAATAPAVLPAVA